MQLILGVQSEPEPVALLYLEAEHEPLGGLVYCHLPFQKEAGCIFLCRVLHWNEREPDAMPTHSEVLE